MTEKNPNRPIGPHRPWVNTGIVRSIAPAASDPSPAPSQFIATTDCAGTPKTSPNRQLVVDPGESQQSITTISARNDPEEI